MKSLKLEAREDHRYEVDIYDSNGLGFIMGYTHRFLNPGHIKNFLVHIEGKDVTQVNVYDWYTGESYTS